MYSQLHILASHKIVLHGSYAIIQYSRYQLCCYKTFLYLNIFIGPYYCNHYLNLSTKATCLWRYNKISLFTLSPSLQPPAMIQNYDLRIWTQTHVTRGADGVWEVLIRGALVFVSGQHSKVNIVKTATHTWSPNFKMKCTVETLQKKHSGMSAHIIKELT